MIFHIYLQEHLKFNYLRLFELLVIICLQFNKWTKDILILVSILIPEKTNTLGQGTCKQQGETKFRNSTLPFMQAAVSSY